MQISFIVHKLPLLIEVSGLPTSNYLLRWIGRRMVIALVRIRCNMGDDQVSTDAVTVILHDLVRDLEC
jgi:hypothetical protein